MEDKSSALGTVLLTAVPPLVWGSTYAVTQLWLPPGRPLFAAVLRILPAGLLLLLWVHRRPRGSWWRRALLLGTLNHAVFFALLYLAAYRLPSGLASTITAVSPLVVMVVARLAIGERQPRVTLLAAVGGVAGVALLVWQSDRSGPVDALGVAAALGAVTAASVGFVLVKRWTAPGEVLATTAWQLVAGGLVLLPLAAATEGAPPALDVPAILALGYLGLVGSLLGYSLWFRGLTRMGAGAVAVVGLVNPVVGTTLGVLLLGEPFGPLHLVATALTLGSVLAAQAPVRGALSAALGPRTGRRSGKRGATEPVPAPVAIGPYPGDHPVVERPTVRTCPT